MTADREIVRDRCERIRKYVKDLRAMADLSMDDFKRNTERQYAVLHALQLAIEASIEIGTHICSADDLGVPATYAETFDLLERGGVLNADLAKALRNMARFRNRMVHFYWEMDIEQVYEILVGRLADFDRYLAAIDGYLGEEIAP